MRNRRPELLALFLLFTAAHASAQMAPALVRQCKDATALIMAGDGDGTAFCVDASGLFVTDLHVVETTNANGRVRLVLRPGEQNQRVLQAVVLRIDKASDLALLSVQLPDAVPALPIGPTDTLVETQPIVAFGYPFGVDLATKEGEYPSVTVSTGHITALRKQNGVLDGIQVDASLTPGSSGGPLLTEQGQVVGIVQKGVPGAGISLARPSGALRHLLSTPVITMSAPALVPKALFQPQVFTIHVVSPAGTARADAVELTLNAGTDDARSYTAAAAGTGSFRVTAPPAGPKLAVAQLRLAAQADGASVTCELPDRWVTLNGKQVALSSIRELHGGQTPEVILTNGQPQPGWPAGMNALDVSIAGAPTRLDLTRFTQVTVSVARPGLQGIPYRVQAHAAGAVLGEITGMLPLAGVPGSHAGGAIRELKLTANDLVFNPVDHKIYASIPSTGGAMGNSVVPIDPVTGKLGKPIPVGSEPHLLALSGDGKQLYVGLDGAHAVREVDLPSQTATVQIPLDGTLTVEDMAVVPNNPIAVAVAIQQPGISPHNHGVVLYVNGQIWSPSKGCGNTIAFSDDGSTLYGYNNETTTFDFYQNAILPGGVLKMTESHGGVIVGPYLHIRSAAGKLYTTSGVVLNPETRRVLGTCAGVQGASSVCPDAQRSKVYYLAGESILGFDSSTFVPLGRADVPQIKGSADSLVQWAPDGLAFRTDQGQVFLVSTALIRPQTEPPPKPTDRDPRLGDDDDAGGGIIILVPVDPNDLLP